MVRKLSTLRESVTCIDRAESIAIERLADCGPGDCLIVFAFPRYSRICQALMEIAKKNGTSVVFVTDKITAPYAKLADVVLPVAVEGLGFANSYVAPLCLVEAIVLYVGQKLDITEDARADVIERYLTQYELY